MASRQSGFQARAHREQAMNIASSYQHYLSDPTARERIDLEARRLRAQAVHRYIVAPVMEWIAGTTREARSLAALRPGGWRPVGHE
jgi:hypothetical protein